MNRVEASQQIQAACNDRLGALDKIMAEMESLRKDAAQRTRLEADRVQELSVDLQRTTEKLREANKEKESAVEQLQSLKESGANELNSLKTTAEDLKGQNDQLRAQLTAANRRYEEVSGRLEAMQQEALSKTDTESALHALEDSVQVFLRDMSGQLNGDKIDSFEDVLKATLSVKHDREEREHALQTQLDAQTRDLQTLTVTCVNINDQLSQVRQEFVACQQELNAFKSREANLKNLLEPQLPDDLHKDAPIDSLLEQVLALKPKPISEKHDDHTVTQMTRTMQQERVSN